MLPRDDHAGAPSAQSMRSPLSGAGTLQQLKTSPFHVRNKEIAMTHRMRSAFLLSALVVGLAGCGENGPILSPTPAAPLPVPARPSATPDFMPDVTLSGVVYEETPSGRAPIEGVWVYCEACGAETHSGAYTDSNGFYSFTGVWTDSGHFPTRIRIIKDGYVDPPGLPEPTPPNPSGAGWREVVINGTTQFDVQLVRR
jgi:predicted small lipoprotein YifL